MNDQAEASDERGNFKSVMITPNNALRQKHQNITTPAPGEARSPSPAPLEPDLATDKIMNELIEFSFEDELGLSAMHNIPMPIPMPGQSKAGYGELLAKARPMRLPAPPMMPLQSNASNSLFMGQNGNNPPVSNTVTPN